MGGRLRFEGVAGVQTLFWRRWLGDVSGHALRPYGSFRARGSRPHSRKARKEIPNTAWPSFRPSSKGNLAVAFRLGGSEIEPTAISFGSQGSRYGGRHLTRKLSAARLKMSIRKEETRRTRSLACFLPVLPSSYVVPQAKFSSPRAIGRTPSDGRTSTGRPASHNATRTSNSRRSRMSKSSRATLTSIIFP
jgi:hypothetical protein